MIDSELADAAAHTLDVARAAGAMIVTAESCTGGLVAGALTAIAGSSDVVFGGTVTYANEAKVALGVPADLIARHGAVSEEVAHAMAAAARAGALRAGAPQNVAAVAITGVAGPGGGSAEKPVGLVHFAVANAAGALHTAARFGPLDRTAIRRASVLEALTLLRTGFEN
ncbi:MAG: CinA family protein [Acuticoccus sp.]